MLIDAAHREETRMVVLRGSKIDEFDYESVSRRQLKGNIYLARVMRIEPSLQAAFVDYGGNRHGFLSFSEIHPDYYQIPVADRQALIEAEAGDQKDDAGLEEAETETELNESAAGDERSGDSDGEDRAGCDNAGRQDADDGSQEQSVGEAAGTDCVELIGAGDAMEEVPRRRNAERSYRIQEVIKRRQILLVQVVKEERGNKGAALTTYLSLAGRYGVLMPNTARGGGISRKITDITDRQRLKAIVASFSVPGGMGLIIRTAGANRTKVEIKRDFDHLLRLWENIRNLTLQSIAPCLIYEEGNLIRRSIRDLYTKDVEAIYVVGEVAYREAKEFMKMLMPSHARHVKAYRQARPLFSHYKVESQLDGLFLPKVTLESGGYIVINQTEALVAIDVNSGKSTREHNIESTALKTNLEAAAEAARQLRLRDLAGLIVIDFIDMGEKRNNRLVERRLREALRKDRARIQMGYITHFGLLEMSRQRLRAGMLEGATFTCPQCDGLGFMRSVESCSLSVLRGIEEHLLCKTESIAVFCNESVASYLLNQKRPDIVSLEATYGASIFIEADNEQKMSVFKIEQTTRHDTGATRPDAAVQIDSASADDAVDLATAVAETSDNDEVEIKPNRSEQKNRSRRRRGRRGGRRNKPALQEQGASPKQAGETGVRPTSDSDGQIETGPDGSSIVAADAGPDEPGASMFDEASAQDKAPAPERRRAPRAGSRTTRSRKNRSADAAPKAADEAAGTQADNTLSSGNPLRPPGVAEAEENENVVDRPKPAVPALQHGTNDAAQGANMAQLTTRSDADGEKPRQSRRRGWWQNRLFSDR